MSIPAQSGPKWAITPVRAGAWMATITFTGASQVSDFLEVGDMPIQCVHIYGSFNAQQVSLQGFNVNDSAASPQDLHQSFNPSAQTFSGKSAELMAGVVENPRYLIAQSNGAVTSVTVSVYCSTSRSR